MATSQFNQTNPWAEIWIRPRKMLEKQLQKDPKRYLLLLAIVNGIVAGGAWIAALLTKYPLRQDYKNGVFGVALIVVGVILSVISLYVTSWLYRLTGGWLKGTGTYTDVKCAVGWSFYPSIVVGIFSILGSLAFNMPFLALLLSLIAVVLSIWSFIILLKLLGQAHNFSAWKALAAVFIAAVLVFVVIMVFILLIPLLQPLFAGVLGKAL